MRLRVTGALLLLSVGCPAQEEPPREGDPAAEAPIVIEDDSTTEQAYRNQAGEIVYESEFLGKKYCVVMREPDPLRPLETGTTYVMACD